MKTTPWSRREEDAWRALVKASLDPASLSGTLTEAAKTVSGARIPTMDRRDMLAFAALQAVARACGEARRERRTVLGPTLATLAVECARSVGWDVAPPARGLAEDKTWDEADLFASLSR